MDIHGTLTRMIEQMLAQTKEMPAMLEHLRLTGELTSEQVDSAQSHIKSLTKDLEDLADEL